LVPLLAPVRLVLVERFSASRFWPLARARGVTHVHYLGGILQILLKQPAAADDADNPVRVAWGGGCPAETWEAFERRFGVVVREDFGLTETSSIVTVNLEGKVGSVGRVLPWFDVRVVDEDGRDAPPGVTGEILVGERIPGLLTRGYFQNEDATRALLRDGWLHTGDLGHLDEEGHLWFGGRKKDSVRRRGENVSAWEVESVVNQHPDVEESALVGVATDVGEEDLKLFVKQRAGAALHPQALVEWCEARMAYFQVPRYVAFVDAFPKTPTERIRKEELSRDTSGCWDREAERRTSEAAR
ncbi:MAG TPA: AMP-binding protein, partial [Actinomycetota bacterium]|nr:AMP-binding protein [Actinomycetota bacterium]